MACTLTTSGRALPCREALGGIKNVWIQTTGFDATDWDAEASGSVVAASGAGVVFKNYVSPKNTSVLEQSINASIEAGTVYFEQVVKLVCHNPSASDITEIQELAKGRLSIIVQDVNDNYFLVGHTRGCELSGGSVGTGTAIGDMNGFTLEFTAQEAIPAPFAPSVDVTGNITFTTV